MEYEAESFQRNGEASRRRIVAMVEKEEAAILRDWGGRIPETFFYLCETMLQQDVEIDGLIWRATYQLGFWRVAGVWRFALGDELVQHEREVVLCAPHSPLTTGPNAVLAFFGLHIGAYAAEVRSQLRNEARSRN